MIIIVGINVNIKSINTVSKLLEILEKKKLLQNRKFKIKINKQIPNKAGLGGGSMNAASILKYFVNKKIIKQNKKELTIIRMSSASDPINIKTEELMFSVFKEIGNALV